MTRFDWRPLVGVFMAILVGLGIGAVLMLIWGYNPWVAYLALLRGAWGDPYAIGNTLSRATPLILTGLTFAIGVRGGLFNIGAQGQMIAGAVAAVAIGGLVSLPPGWHLLVAAMAAMAAGALWSLPAAILKLSRGVHEVISTIMLNLIMQWFAIYLVVNALSDPVRGERTVQVATDARFASLLAGSGLTSAIIAAVAVAVGLYYVLWHLASGYELRASGLNPDAARYAGMRPGWSLTLAFLLGGVAAGLAGATQVLGRFPYALTNTLSTVGTLGFDGIAVALVARNHPLAVIPSALFFGMLNAGGFEMGREAGVPIDMVQIVQGTIILAVAVPEIWRLGRSALARGASSWGAGG